MPNRFKDKNKAPPGGWFVYHDTEHNTVLKAPSWRRLVDTIRKYCTANSFNMPSEQQITDNVCAGMPGICYDADAPPVWRQAVNFVTEAAAWAKAGIPVTPQETLNSRLQTCEACNHWGGTPGGSLMSGRCGKCGCTGLKLAMATTKCPIGKW